MAKTDMPAGRRRRTHAQLWNDDVFRNRVLMLAEKRGLSVRAAMREAGFTVDYADREMEMRNSNQLMVLAEYFGVSPAYLCGWHEPDNPGGATPRQKGRDATARMSRGFDHERQLTAEYREWLGKLIIEMVQIAQQGAGDVYGIAERVLTTAGLEGQSFRTAPGSADATTASGAAGDRN